MHQNTTLRQIPCWEKKKSNYSANPLFYGILKFIAAFPEACNGIVFPIQTNRVHKLTNLFLWSILILSFHLRPSISSGLSLRARSVARPWTQWTPAAPSASACMYILWFVNRMLDYTRNVYVKVYKAPLSGPQNQHFNYITHSKTLHKTYCIRIHFWKWVVSNNSGSTAATG